MSIRLPASAGVGVCGAIVRDDASHRVLGTGYVELHDQRAIGLSLLLTRKPESIK